MYAIRLLGLAFVSAAVLAAPATALATVQFRDVVRFEGKIQFMMECPLNQLLWRLPDPPEFEWQNTANYKGYTAEWEIKDGELLLVSFEAKRKLTDPENVPLEAILPGRKLPVHADWYTGRIRIPIGEPIERGNLGVFGAVFARVVVLHFEKGKVIKAEELKNARIKSPSDERDDERSRHWLWPFPKLEAGTVRALGIAGPSVYLTIVPPAAIRRTAAWSNDGTDPPLSMSKAKLLAETKSRELVPPGAKYTLKVDTSTLKKWSEDRYYYEFSFYPNNATSRRHPPNLMLLVLMDGTVPAPQVWDGSEFAPAFQGGAFDIDQRRTATDLGPWTFSDEGTPWADLSWRFRLSLLESIAAAPKLLYEIEKLEVYSNGVWAEYSVTNESSQRKFFSPELLQKLVRSAGLWDSAGRKWQPAKADVTVDSEGPQEFVAIEARQTVRYRARLTDRSSKPFGLVRWRYEPKPGRPEALEYFIAAWPRAFTRLTENGDSDVQAFVFGYGRVPVQWFDKPYPPEWPYRTHLFGPPVVK